MHALQEVWIRPRKVFRELADRPVGAADFLLSAAQGMVGILVLSRMKGLGASVGVAEIMLKAALQGAVSGIAIIWIQAWIYTWLGRHAGGVASKSQVIHVLAYGSTPLVASLGIWCLAVVLLGEQAFIERPGGETDPFVALLMTLQVSAHVLLAIWSAILQVMGLSEMHKVRTGGALGTWLLGQFVAVFALVIIMLVLVGMGMPLPQT